MKLALIGDQYGLPIIDELDLSYHLVLAQYLHTDSRYASFYREKGARGDFIMLDNGAAEGELMAFEDLRGAMDIVVPDEVILPDVLKDSHATIRATMDKNVLALIPPKQRAVVPQGDSFEEWSACANHFVRHLEFVTMCIPKHAERFEGGRINLLDFIERMGWNRTYHVHLLGVWGEPRIEVPALRAFAPWVRGIDTAAPFAYAQADKSIRVFSPHISHKWRQVFKRDLAYENALALLGWASWS